MIHKELRLMREYSGEFMKYPPKLFLLGCEEVLQLDCKHSNCHQYFSLNKQAWNNINVFEYIKYQYADTIYEYSKAKFED